MGPVYQLTKSRLAFNYWDQNEVGFVVNVVYSVTIFRVIYGWDFSSTPKLFKIADLPRDACHYMEWDSYIVECAGDILVVVKKYGFSDDEVYYTTNFRVFKLDVESKKVVEVKSIRDYALFLGLNNSFRLPTTLYKYSRGIVLY